MTSIINLFGAGVTYEWGISSSSSIGSVEPIYKDITTFTPANTGTGDLWVVATQNELSVTKSIPVVVEHTVTPISSPSLSVSPMPSAPLGTAQISIWFIYFRFDFFDSIDWGYF